MGWPFLFHLHQIDFNRFLIFLLLVILVKLLSNNKKSP
ncbi:hypothetical protein ymoll0001_28040 [Yersinia mollaretii ATCC 43969]|uniref:Uncharacterized protein n=1 Tax=Yersinia mollaretii (strain ATCC 43969 / DSM 18520 / CIP 103324 / CNY 7263 / WAIP 204) TaxID=349967 RepID=A0ABM9Y5P0_YERMW|nr:hypothetical protein ymoll0001_28040 [Yersinia mollaretii ATCC 43969]